MPNNENNDPVSKTKKERLRRVKQIIWRDFTFLILGIIAASIMGYMEMHAADVNLRGGDDADLTQADIVDAGYIATKPLHDFLKKNRRWNDVFAFINTVIGVIGPGVYMLHSTFWVGDYEPVFRYGAISMIRSYCGFFTYLPPDASYLMSNYDFPDISQCLLKECQDPEFAEINPFVSFFSGHVATLVIVANHAYLHGHKKLGIFFHVFNVLQIIRLLATRGHYSIDIIIGWYMAIYVSNPAGRLGRFFSRGDEDKFMDMLVPTTATQAFETMIGVADERKDARLSVLLKQPEVLEALKAISIEQTEEEIYPETTVKMAVEGKLEGVKLD